MKKKLTAFAIICSLTAFGQIPKERLFTNTVKQIINIVSKGDSVEIEKYIDKKIGMYIIYRPGVYDAFKHTATLRFSHQFDTNPSTIDYNNELIFTTLKYASLPNYDCSADKWTKQGIYVDTTQIDHLLSKTAKNLNEVLDTNSKISSKTISSFWDLESKSRRICVIGKKGDEKNEFIFYLSFIKNKWVLTIIDKVSSDCSV
jgi:hypothetical protein